MSDKKRQRPFLPGDLVLWIERVRLSGKKHVFTKAIIISFPGIPGSCIIQFMDDNGDQEKKLVNIVNLREDPERPLLDK